VVPSAIYKAAQRATFAFRSDSVSAVGFAKPVTTIPFSLSALRRLLNVLREVFSETAALREKHRSEHSHFEW
jgi:hypothetical protein